MVYAGRRGLVVGRISPRWGKDCGIDLVYADRQGNHWAVQSKCISPEREISKAEIDSFLSESSDSKIHGRLLIASTDGIGKNAQQVIDRQEKQVDDLRGGDHVFR